MNEDLKEKYGCYEIENSRYYVIDLSEHPMLPMETTNLQYFRIEDYVFEAKTWNAAFAELVSLLYNVYGKKDADSFYDFTTDWTDKTIFFDTEKPSSIKIDKRLYANYNFITNQMVYLFIDLLKYFEIDPGKCRMVVKRKNNTEPSKILNYAMKRYINEFVSFVCDKYGISRNNAITIAKSIMDLDTVLKGYNINGARSFFLLDDRVLYQCVKAAFLKRFKEETKYRNKEKMSLVDEYLSYLTSFVTKTYPIKKDTIIDFESMSIIEKEKIDDKLTEKEMGAIVSLIESIPSGKTVVFSEIESKVVFDNRKHDDFLKFVNECVNDETFAITKLADDTYIKI